MLKKTYVRNGGGSKCFASITSGFSGDVKIVRDMHDNLLAAMANIK
jgi:hypothetical protein